MQQNQRIFFAGWQFCLAALILNSSTAAYGIYNAILDKNWWMLALCALALIFNMPFVEYLSRVWRLR